MANPKTIVCPSCSFRNTPPPPNHRCGSCGAKMEALGQAIAAKGARAPLPARGFQPDLDADLADRQGVLTAARSSSDCPSWCPFSISKGATACSSRSRFGSWGPLGRPHLPGRTSSSRWWRRSLPPFRHLYLVRRQTMRTMPTCMYVIMATIGVLFTLIGSYLGERVQMGPPPKPAD